MVVLASLLVLSHLSSFAFGQTDSVSSPAQQSLAQAALAAILDRGSPILGFDTGCESTNPTCDWMATIPDDTKLVHMSIPGTHDSSTWNYTQATQDEYLGFTGVIPLAEFFQCQEHSYFQMLNGGIRVFDLRVAWNPGNVTIGFYHSQALLAPGTRLQDVLFGFYYWLDAHPTEAVLLSINYESDTGTQDTQAFQEALYAALMNEQLASKYWLQVNGTLGTLGEARGKLTLLQRFDYNLLPDTPNYSKRIGIHLDPEDWIDNDPNITLVYNTVDGVEQIAYIEDYYEIDGLPDTASAALNIQWKYNATIAHLEEAIDPNFHPDQLYITFASSEHDTDGETPRIMALGNGTDVPGVNQKILPWLQQNSGKRFGIVMLDFFDSVPGVVEAIIGV